MKIIRTNETTEIIEMTGYFNRRNSVINEYFHIREKDYIQITLWGNGNWVVRHVDFGPPNDTELCEEISIEEWKEALKQIENHIDELHADYFNINH